METIHSKYKIYIPLAPSLNTYPAHRPLNVSLGMNGAATPLPAVASFFFPCDDDLSWSSAKYRDNDDDGPPKLIFFMFFSSFVPFLVGGYMIGSLSLFFSPSGSPVTSLDAAILLSKMALFASASRNSTSSRKGLMGHGGWF